MPQSFSEPMADVRDMYMMHTMFRREFGLLAQLIRNVANGDIRRAAVVADHADKICLILHLHHEGEDKSLWPRLLERGGDRSANLVPRMEEQHHGIEAALHEVISLLPAWRATVQGGEQLAAAIEILTARLLEHMALEEKEILPLAEEFVTAREWTELAEHGLANSPKKDLPLAFGMAMYEGDPATVKAVLGHAPLLARLLMPVVAPRLYAAHAKRVYGTRTPPRLRTV